MKPIRATDVKALSAQCMLAGDVHGHIDQLARNPAIKASVKNALYLDLSKAFARKGDKFTAIHFASLPLQQGQSASDKQHLAAIRQLMALGQHEQALRYQIARHLNALNGRNSDAETKTALLNTFRAWTTCDDTHDESTQSLARDHANVLLDAAHKLLKQEVSLARQRQQANSTELIKHVNNSNSSFVIEKFNESMQIVDSARDASLISQASTVHAASQLGLLPQAASLLKSQLNVIKRSPSNEQSRIKIIETELELLHHELSLAQQRQLLPTPQIGNNWSKLEIQDEWKSQLKRKSFSQLGQDLWVLEKIDYKSNGFFVEFGATDGVLLSNTFLLEREFGWTGICAEPNPKFYTQLQKNRQCTLSNQCISGFTGKIVDFIYADVYGGSLEYADADMHKEKRAAYITSNRMEKITTISLHDFLIEHKAPFNIDYLSIDTEGSELEILESFPLSLWNIKLITVEHNYGANRIEIEKFLCSHGYKCQPEKFDDWYEKL